MLMSSELGSTPSSIDFRADWSFLGCVAFQGSVRAARLPIRTGMWSQMHSEPSRQPIFSIRRTEIFLSLVPIRTIKDVLLLLKKKGPVCVWIKKKLDQSCKETKIETGAILLLILVPKDSTRLQSALDCSKLRISDWRADTSQDF
jgi:hypothetical protein